VSATDTLLNTAYARLRLARTVGRSIDYGGA
jgi:hypothetical protein